MRSGLMTIAILYESEEWSNIYLRDYIRDKGCEVMFVNFEKAVLNAAFFDSAALLVNRIFPSSYNLIHFHGFVKSKNRKLAERFELSIC
jgi:hypothetical protein